MGRAKNLFFGGSLLYSSLSVKNDKILRQSTVLVQKQSKQSGRYENAAIFFVLKS